MRWPLLLVLCLFLVACIPEPETKGIVQGLKENTDNTRRLVGDAISGDYEQVPKTCMDDPDCGLGRMCQNKTCVLKQKTS